MQREVRYLTSADGTRIAYSLCRERPGTPFVQVYPWVLSEDLRLREPRMRRWYEGVASHATLISYDARGVGASQRDVDDVSAQAQLADLDAVVETCGLSRFNLMSFGTGGVAAAMYAAAHPERVERLILQGIQARWSALQDRDDFEAMLQLARTSWPLASVTLVELVWPKASPELRRAAAAALRSAISADVAVRYMEFQSSYDITETLRAIRTPTLVLQGSGSRRSVEGVRSVAALIPGARFVHAQTPDYGTEVEEQLQVIREFTELRPGEEHRTADASGGTAVILFADIASSTALTERVGDARFRAAARAIEDPMRSAVRDAGGEVVEGKLLGDGLLALFSSARQAIAAALRCAEISAAGELRLHLGIHAGDVIREANNVYGGAVNIAARISDVSDPGEILVSATVREIARTSTTVTFEDRGERQLKGIADPVRVFAVRDL